MYQVEFPGLGLEFTLNRVAFTLFGMPVYWYGILIALGMLLALVFAFRCARPFGIDADRMIDAILIGTVCSIIGGRVFYVAMAPFKYESFAQMIDIRQGGMAIYGCVIGAFIGGFFACKWRKVPVLPMFDVTALGFLIGQGVGRWGNFVNQEAFGANTTMPWGMISNGTAAYLSRVQATLAEQGITVDPAMPVHPTFFYESVWCILGFFVLWAFMKHRRFHGELFLMYLAWYGAERLVVEGLRTDSLMLGSFRVSQLIAALSVLIAGGLWLFLRRKYKDTPLVITLNTFPKIDGRTVPCAVTWKKGATPPTDKEIVEAAKEILARQDDPNDGPTAVFFTWPPSERDDAAQEEAAESAGSQPDIPAVTPTKEEVEKILSPDAAEASEAPEAPEASEAPEAPGAEGPDASNDKKEADDGTDH